MLDHWRFRTMVVTPGKAHRLERPFSPSTSRRDTTPPSLFPPEFLISSGLNVSAGGDGVMISQRNPATCRVVAVAGPRQELIIPDDPPLNFGSGCTLFLEQPRAQAIQIIIIDKK